MATLATARAFQQLGFGVDIIVYFDEIDTAMLDTFRQAGITVIESGIHRGGAKTHFLLALSLVRILLLKRYSLIWLQFMTPSLVPLLVARCFTRRLVAAVHTAAGHYSQQGILRIRWLARYWCSRFVCVSHTAANGIFGEHRADGIYAKRVVVISNSLDASEAATAAPRRWRDELNWPQDRPIVGYCGRLAAIKGADILLEAVALLIRKGGRIGVVLVGDGEERARLQSLATELGIGDLMHFAGRIPRDDIFSAIRGFDIAVVPSREEGFGLSALEAMAVGLPLVASNVDALGEVVEDGCTGLLFNSGDPADLSEKIATLMHNQDLARQLGVQGKRHAHDNFDVPVFRARVATLLSSLGLAVGSDF